MESYKRIIGGNSYETKYGNDIHAKFYYTIYILYIYNLCGFKNSRKKKKRLVLTDKEVNKLKLVFVTIKLRMSS